MFHIGKYAIKGQAILAPMAGVTDLPFRQLCLQHGAALATSEMLTSDTRLWDSDKSRTRLQMNKHSNVPNSVQIAGTCPQQMALAAKQCVEYGAQIIDINMGCPAKKVCKKLAGSALLKDEGLVFDILKSVVSSVDVPVTLKTRTGWNPAKRNGVHIAELAEQAGIAAIAIHGRTRECRFNGHAEYDSIAKIVDAVSIPVMANGDITTPEKARDVLEHTGAAAVMIGRAAFGNPWIFSQINALFAHSTTQMDTNNLQSAFVRKLHDIEDTVIKHITELHTFYGEFKGLRISRKHFTWYIQGLPESKASISTFNKIESSTKQIDHIKKYFKHLIKYEEFAA